MEPAPEPAPDGEPASKLDIAALHVWSPADTWSPSASPDAADYGAEPISVRELATRLRARGGAADWLVYIPPCTPAEARPVADMCDVDMRDANSGGRRGGRLATIRPNGRPAPLASRLHRIGRYLLQ